jgi:hypothetical protein
VFGRIVFAALPLAGLGCGPRYSDPCVEAHPTETIVALDGGVPDGGLFGDACLTLCPSGYDECSTAETDAGAPVAVCACHPVGGRAPRGLQQPEVRGGTAIARHFADCAHLEAASVLAFRGLATELQPHGAPASLIRALRCAAGDEVLHAVAMTRLAHQSGMEPAPVRIEPGPPRTLADIAEENAFEGCVREGYGALVALWQAGAAGDPNVRAIMSRIAVDETRHAELSWSLARWMWPQLDPAARRRIRDAQARGLAWLEEGASRALDPELVEKAGLPSPAVARQLLRGLAAAVTEMNATC